MERVGSKKYISRSRLLIAIAAYKQTKIYSKMYSNINFKHKNHWQPTHLASNLDELKVPPNLSQK